jgi:hypothetical protein
MVAGVEVRGSGSGVAEVANLDDVACDGLTGALQVRRGGRKAFHAQTEQVHELRIVDPPRAPGLDRSGLEHVLLQVSRYGQGQGALACLLHDDEPHAALLADDLAHVGDPRRGRDPHELHAHPEGGHRPARGADDLAGLHVHRHGGVAHGGGVEDGHREVSAGGQA